MLCSIGIMISSNGKKECGTLPWFGKQGKRPDLAAMAIYHALDYRQTHSDTGEFIIQMQSFERHENIIRESHIKANAVISHETDRFPAFQFRAELDSRRIAP